MASDLHVQKGVVIMAAQGSVEGGRVAVGDGCAGDDDIEVFASRSGLQSSIAPLAGSAAEKQVFFYKGGAMLDKRLGRGPVIRLHNHTAFASHSGVRWEIGRFYCSFEILI